MKSFTFFLVATTTCHHWLYRADRSSYICTCPNMSQGQRLFYRSLSGNLMSSQTVSTFYTLVCNCSYHWITEAFRKWAENGNCQQHLYPKWAGGGGVLWQRERERGQRVATRHVESDCDAAAVRCPSCCWCLCKTQPQPVSRVVKELWVTRVAVSRFTVANRSMRTRDLFHI